MSDLLRDVLRAAAADGSPPASVDDLHTGLVRRRRRRRQLRGAAAMTVTALSVTSVALLAQGSSPSRAVVPSRDPGTWRVLEASPLSARVSPVSVTVGHEAVFLGGHDGHECRPGDDCIVDLGALKDGAAYDVTTRTWRRLPDAPVVPTQASVAVVGDVVHLMTQDRHDALDLSRGTWSRLPMPAREGLHGPPTFLVAAGAALLATYAEGDLHDQVYDAEAKTWSELPVDPIAPTFDRSYTWTGTRLVLLAPAMVPNPGQEPTYLKAAALDLDSRTWTVLPTATDILSGGSGGWTWDGHLLVNPSQDRVDGGEVNNYGRAIPAGGTFDPVTGKWGSLPAAPPMVASTGRSYYFGVDVSNRRYQASGTFLYDSVARQWQRVSKAPPEAQPESGQTWVGDELVVFSGRPIRSSFQGQVPPIGTGAVYRP
jgi:hypothetical protein